MSRRWSLARPLLALVVLLFSFSPARAQLRPLDPMDWKALDEEDRAFEVSVGTGLYFDQRASLAGTRGRLLEIGSYRGTWLAGQIAVELAGTAVRVFEDHRRIADPYGDARAFSQEVRLDAGDHRLSTILGLTPGGGSVDAAIRFGVRLPTTNDTAGLERDQTDFFATLGGRYKRGRGSISGEAGLGVLGTRYPEHEQVDPILYAGDVTFDWGWVISDLEVVGQHDPRRSEELRGNEDLGELRLGLRSRGSRWMRVAVVHGLETYSPRFGMLLEVGLLH
jgi:hypothetical protein